jgi:glycosyltransferase involved in cell wall biosynthesis
LRVLVLTPYLYGTTAGPRSSFELWERVLAPAGITLVHAPFESERLHEIIYLPGRVGSKAIEMLRGWWRRVLLMRELGDYDAVLVNREAALFGPELLERWVARRGLPLIYLLDDPLYVPYRSPSSGYLSYLKFFGKVKRICRLSRVVIVNSRSHYEFAHEHAGDVRLIPSVVDADAYRFEPRPATEASPVCVGWSGSQSTLPNLGVILDTLRWLGARDDVRLHFIGSERFDLPGVPHTAQAWRPETEVEDLRKLDVGLVPLPVDAWSVRKFYLKLVQYMALGIPPVCSPLGSNPEVVEDGVTGFLVDDETEWKRALSRLIEDADLRAQMGRAAAERAHADYTLQANADRIVAAFEAARD